MTAKDPFMDWIFMVARFFFPLQRFLRLWRSEGLSRRGSRASLAYRGISQSLGATKSCRPSS